MEMLIYGTTKCIEIYLMLEILFNNMQTLFYDFKTCFDVTKCQQKIR